MAFLPVLESLQSCLNLLTQFYGKKVMFLQTILMMPPYRTTHVMTVPVMRWIRLTLELVADLDKSVVELHSN